ncbi:MAG: HEAT repeat domain-containing protein [bacterium]
MSEGHHLSTKKADSIRSLFLYILLSLFIGFISGEIMGWVLVADSNKTLLAEQQWMVENVYIAVPGINYDSEIKSWKTHFAGGLFFGLSIGLCYAFIWSLFFWIILNFKQDLWRFLYKLLHEINPVIFLITWICFYSFIFYLIPAFFKLFYNLFTTGHWAFGLFLLIVPLVLYKLLLITKLYKNERINLTKTIPYIAGFLGAIIMVSMLIATSLTGRDFIRIRDGLFGRIEWGRRISNFYYHYTLYPARVIKTFDQRLQRFLRIDSNDFSEEELKQLKRIFTWRDIFIGEDAPSDTVIKKDKETGNMIIISKKHGFSIETSLENFFKDPKKIIVQYDIRTDSAAPLRRVVSLSLFNIWPLMGIFLIYLFLIIICGLLFKKSSSTRDTLFAFFSILLLIMGFRSLMVPKNISLDTENLLNTIEGNGSGNKITSIMALWERIEKDKNKVGHFSEHFIKMLDDPDPIIRKWGIDFITLSGEKKAINIIIRLLNDPDPNVAYHAARSLGKFEVREAREPLLKILEGKREWYLKTTAYIALRETGWSQLSLKRNLTEKRYQ